MQKDYENILQLINNSDTSLDLLKNTCEAFLDTYCNQEGMVLYSDLIRKIAAKEGIKIES